MMKRCLFLILRESSREAAGGESDGGGDQIQRFCVQHLQTGSHDHFLAESMNTCKENHEDL